MYPTRLNRVQPGAFLGQQEGEQTDIALAFGLLIVGAYPSFQALALVPTGVIPDDSQDTLVFLSSDIQ